MPLSRRPGSEAIDPSLGDKARREALGLFLRERREAIAPGKVGLSSGRKRRTPGLRREEVAFLADIGVKWYARLEACDDIHPSAAALAGIAFALQLSAAEHEYLVSLAGLSRSEAAPAKIFEIPKALELMIDCISGVAVTRGDRILTPLQWNATADAMYGFSEIADPVERNSLVRSLFDPDFISFLGNEADALISNAVGMFRLNYSSQSPSPFATAIYERVKDNYIFQKFWRRQVVENHLTVEGTMVRNHARVGRLEMHAIDFNATTSSDWLFRVMIPADDTTASKFLRLDEIGKAKMSARSAVAFGRGSAG